MAQASELNWDNSCPLKSSMVFAERQVNVTRISGRMKLNRTHSILLLTAIFHLLADMAFAGGAVLCVGANDHTEIEAGHVARDCGPFQDANLQANDPQFAIGETSDCTDIPLHSDAEMASKDFSWDPTSPATLTLTSRSYPLLIRGRDLHIGLGIDLAPTMRVHRSIVLII